MKNKLGLIAAVSVIAMALTPSVAVAQKDKDKKAAAVAAPASGGRVFATADLDAALALTNAYKTAMEQMRVTYKPQIDARDSRAKVLQAELQSMGVALQEASKKPGATEKTLEPQIRAYQQKEAAAQQEIAQLSQPIDLALAYVREQIAVNENTAVRNAMSKQGIDVLIKPEAVLYITSSTADLSRKIVDEYNALVSNVQIVPPQGYRPGQIAAQLAQQAQGAAAQPGAAPATTPAPTPRPQQPEDGR
jgi:Skp family chaperone for outer membrane proteins